MTEHSKKQQLLELIRANPFISQQELATSLGLSRSAVAGYIAGLIRERKLLGRAYVLPDRRPVTCIGAANLDRKLRSLAGIALHTSNPASQSESFGGVARNIAENLARLGTPVALLTATGKDSSGAALLAHAQSLGIDTGGTLQLPDLASGTYTAVLDQDGEMVVALADMALYDRLDPAFIASSQTRIATSALVVADLNLPLDTVDAVVAQARRAEVPLVLVAVSEPKMARLPQDLSGVRLLILNRGELAARVGRELASETALDAAIAEVRAQGARDLIVTRGAEGVMYTRGGAGEDQIVRLYAHGAEVVDVTGAGDAFAAAVCWSLMQDGDDLELACRRGLKLSALTLGVPETVHPRLAPDTLMNTNTQD
ncbi:carbohydrate kinase [Massilia norwichensis]|uniref:Winged helix-turn-helix transcriptional regulator n=1 Tax=Massilia norwichensis TaxID=1442366 RepID=A0ABT2A8H2_9BURK|nr:winged helix-turn-helix transcriptional regulator [Massilia norwichensis]